MGTVKHHHFEKYAAHGYEFLKKVAKRLGEPENKDKAFRVTKAVLHALRNRLYPAEFVQMLAQLPMCIKAVAVDGWHFREKPEKIRHLDEFIEEVMKEDQRLAHHDFPTKEDALKAIKAVFGAIKEYVSEGEIKDVEAELPEPLKKLMEEAA
ncbi:MAG: DUF2267 domain-containing protein [Aquificae bacterium]|nr:DUF2267 domain-containing protein [Aquificota bacterium]